MQVILLERIPKLGQMGDTVRVREGYARNFLLPQGKALRATDANRARFEAQRAQLEARNLELKNEAESVAATLNGQSIVVIRQAGERGQLYGSVSTRDIAELLTQAGFSVTRNQVALNAPIKSIGLVEVTIGLHPEVEATIAVNVARSEDEAERQARGENATAPDDDEDAGPAAEIEAEAFFEEGAELDIDEAELADESAEADEELR